MSLPNNYYKGRLLILFPAWPHTYFLFIGFKNGPSWEKFTNVAEKVPGRISKHFYTVAQKHPSGGKAPTPNSITKKLQTRGKAPTQVWKGDHGKYYCNHPSRSSNLDY
jgi:hypothetical protein